MDYQEYNIDYFSIEFLKKYEIKKPLLFLFIFRLKRILIDNDKLYDDSINFEKKEEEKLLRLKYLNKLLNILIPLYENDKEKEYTNEELKQLYNIIILEYNKVYPIPKELIHQIPKKEQEEQSMDQMEQSTNSIQEAKYITEKLRRKRLLQQIRKIEEERKLNREYYADIMPIKRRKININDDDMNDDMNGGNIYKEKYYKYKLKYLKKINKI